MEYINLQPGTCITKTLVAHSVMGVVKRFGVIDSTLDDPAMQSYLDCIDTNGVNLPFQISFQAVEISHDISKPLGKIHTWNFDSQFMEWQKQHS